MTDTPQRDEPPQFGAREAYPAASSGGSADDNLPPVEPPSARFIIQLFVVPAVIVVLVVGIWIVVTSFVHRAMMRPEDVIQGLESSSVARWQRASELADLLRNDRFAEFRAIARQRSSWPKFWTANWTRPPRVSRWIKRA